MRILAADIAGLDTPGVLLGEAEEDKENQGLLLALFTLVISPNLANCFPSLELYYASQAQSSTTSAEWSDRLTLIIKDTTCPTDFAQVLKYLLRRLDPSSSTLTTQARLSLDLNLYRSFARSEKEAGYPTDAYEKIFAPRIDTKQMTYLEEIFEVWAALAAHSDGNGMTGGQITRYLGWWVWGSSVKQDSRWEALYDEWAEAGRRIDHLFHAWIRCVVRFTRLRELMPELNRQSKTCLLVCYSWSRVILSLLLRTKTTHSPLHPHLRSSEESCVSH